MSAAAGDTGTLADRLRRLTGSGFLDLPLPGTGSTPERLRRLARISAGDLSLGRVAEAHLDAITILREAGREPTPDALYGVWASEAPHARLQLQPAAAGWTMSGRKAFCTGAGLLDRALVTARPVGSDDVLLIDLAVAQLERDPSTWITMSFADTDTATVTVADTHIDAETDVLGGPGWYLDRVGFWQGALAPAACWAGGAIGLVDHCFRIALSDADDLTAAHLGVLDSARWELRAVLDAAGAEVDADPVDADLARLLARRARTAVERLVTLVVDHSLRCFGPRLLAMDPWASRRIGELQLYVRQHHDSRDHAALGHDALEDERSRPHDPASRCDFS